MGRRVSAPCFHVWHLQVGGIKKSHLFLLHLCTHGHTHTQPGPLLASWVSYPPPLLLLCVHLQLDLYPQHFILCVSVHHDTFPRSSAVFRQQSRCECHHVSLHFSWIQRCRLRSVRYFVCNFRSVQFAQGQDTEPRAPLFYFASINSHTIVDPTI